MSWKLKTALWVGCVMILPMLAQAYVYPPSFVYEKWSDQAKGIARVSYRQSVRQLDEVKPGMIYKVSIDRSGLFNKTQATSATSIVVGRSKASQTQNGQKQAISLPQAMNPFEMIWTFGKSDQLLIRLDQLWLRSANHQWFLMGLDKMWMHGQPKGNFLLLSPKTYLPMMAQKDDFIYRAHYEPRFSSVFPKKIVVFKHKQPYQEIVLDQLSVNPSLPARLFQP